MFVLFHGSNLNLNLKCESFEESKIMFHPHPSGDVFKRHC